MLDPIVQSAFVVIVTWLLKKAAEYFKFPLDEETLNTIAAAIVAFLLAQLGVTIAQGLLPGLTAQGLL